MKEIWKPIKGYEGIYEISNMGRVKSLERTIVSKGMERRLKTRIMKPIKVGEYLGVQLSKNGVIKKHFMHRLVASHFISYPSDNLVVNHKDGNRYNNIHHNLEWVSQGDNIKHAYETNLNKNYGENSHYCKFTDETVEKVRTLYKTGNYKQSELAEIFNISRMQIHRIVKYKNRKRKTTEVNK